MKIGRNSNLSALSKWHLLRFVFVRAKKKVEIEDGLVSALCDVSCVFILHAPGTTS